MAKKKKNNSKTVETLTHDEASRKNIPTAEYESVMREDEKDTIRVAYERRNRDLDPQLVWRGKDEQDWSDLVVQAPPLYIQEKVHPKVLIDDLMCQTREQQASDRPEQLDLFADFNGLPTEGARTEFYQHEAEINREVWETLNSDISRPFPKPASGRIAVKVINHLGDEVMKVFRVGTQEREMEFRIADTFIDSLSKLPSEEQKAVKTTAFDLQMNPANWSRWSRTRATY